MQKRHGHRLTIPAAVRRAARDLEGQRGVVGVFWGVGKRRGKWLGEPGIVVHVRRKLPLGQLGNDRLPRKLAGYRVDVLAVGDPAHQWLDPSDLVKCTDVARGRSTITALGKTSTRAYALPSGHGTLPALDGHLVSVFSTSSPMQVTALAPGGVVYLGDLQAGQLDANSDYAFATMQAGVNDVNAFHLAAGRYPPLEIRTSTLGVGDKVSHYSALRSRLMHGTVRQIATTPVYVAGYGGQQFPYAGVVFADSHDPAFPFSTKGDSGSLVVDDQQRVIGTIVAGDDATNVSYVLPISGSVAALGSNATLFFQ